MIKTIQEQEDQEYQKFLRDAEDKEYQEFLQNSDILPTPEEIKTQTSNPLKNLKINPYLLSGLGGITTAVNTQIGLGVGVASLIYQIAKDVKEGTSLSDAFRNAGAIALSFGGGTKALKLLKTFWGTIKATPKTKKFVEKSIEIIESQAEGKAVAPEEIQQLEKMLEDPSVQKGLQTFNNDLMKFKDRIPELGNKLLKEFKKPYNKELEALSSIPQEEIASDVLQKFRQNIGDEGLSNTTELFPAIQNIEEIVQSNNPSNMDILRQAFSPNNPSQQPTRFPSVKMENFPLPKQLRTPYENAIYEAIKPRLQNLEAQKAMDWLYQKTADPTLIEIFKKIEKNSNLQPSQNNKLSQIMKFLLKN